jgi:hypothetical protein
VSVRLLPVASKGPGPPRRGAWSPLSFHSFFCAAALVHSTSPDGAVVAILGSGPALAHIEQALIDRWWHDVLGSFGRLIWEYSR